MKAGDVFRLVKGADKHAKIIISDPENYPDNVLFVGMTSWDAREDHSCVLSPGDHSTVFHRTCISYSRGNAKASNNDLDAMVKAGLIMVFEQVSAEVLAKIRRGGMDSIRTPKDFKEMLVQQNLVDAR